MFGALLATALSGFFYVNIGAVRPRHRRRHHGRHHRPWYRRPWHRRPWRRTYVSRRPWWGFGWSTSKYTYEDNLGEMFWEVRNDTPMTITVSSDTHRARIRPGHRAKLYRDSSFRFDVESEDGQTGGARTDNHFVNIYTSRSWYSPWGSRLKIRSYTAWPGEIAGVRLGPIRMGVRIR